MKNVITHPRLIELLDFDPETGAFAWRQRNGNPSFNARFCGKRVGAVHPTGYLIIQVDGGSYLAHRLAWLHVTGQWPKNEIDHKNGNKLDNSFNNLRPATRSQNAANRIGNSTTGYKGVYQKTSGRYQAMINTDGRTIGLGTFDTPEEAHAAYFNASTFFHGDFANGRCS